jgi:uncharacterized protein involved in exopolysaccharide biosynthesis
MELADFVSLLKRYRLILIFLPIVSICVAYYFTRNLPDSYMSSTQLSTGIVDKSQSLPDAQSSGESEIFMEFSNIITTMKMNKILNQVSYQLILHDLTSTTTFRPPSKLFRDLNESARAHAVEVYTKMYNTHGTLRGWDHDEAGLSSVISSMKYDAGSIGAKLTIYRQENSDFIQVEYESENPLLSAFVVNTMVKEFINYYNSTEQGNEAKSVNFLDSLLTQKKGVMDKEIDSLKQYKIANHIIDISDQAKILSGQLAELEGKKQTVENTISANEGAIKSLDAKIGPDGQEYFNNKSKLVNQKVIKNQQLINTLNNSYITSGFNPYYKNKMDSVQSLMDEQIAESVDGDIDNPQATKATLVNSKISLEVGLNIAKSSVPTIDGQIGRIKAQLDVLGPQTANIAAMQNKIEEDSKEYADILDKYNKAHVQSQFSSKLHQIDMAMPGGPTGSKKMLITVNAGVISELLAVLILFILFYLDDTIKHPKALANKTGLPVLGYLNVIKGSTLDLKKLWDIENRSKMQQFKDLLRSIRFEIDQELHGNKVLAITSLGDGDGKTLLAISLAYSYSIINKKVLLIDGNFSNPTISTTVQPKLFIEDYFRDDPDPRDVINNTTISVLGNQGNDVTLLEIEAERVIQQKFLKLKSMYDIVIIEVQDMDKMNKAKEWLLFADKTIAVFENRQTLDENKMASVKYFQSLGPKFAGWIFNRATAEPHT